MRRTQRHAQRLPASRPHHPGIKHRENSIERSKKFTTYDTGALISALCLADSGTTATETIAEHLTAALNERTDPEGTDPEGWELYAGITSVISSDN